MLYNKIMRRITALTKTHPTSAPFLSGDTFRHIANHVHDEHSTIKPEAVRSGDVIFVSSPYLEGFFSQVLPLISEPFVLISHNGDRNVLDNDTRYLGDKIIHWYAQNCLVHHPSITPLPIGLENQRLYQHGDVRLFSKIMSNNRSKKKERILYKFNPATNPTVRESALSALQNHSLAETYSDWRAPARYLETLQEYAFVASPVGNGHDCIRTWEAFYLKTVPIVTRSVSTEYWESLGLPIYLIHDWTELSSLTPDHLAETYAKMLPKFDSPALWLPYWKAKLHNHS